MSVDRRRLTLEVLVTVTCEAGVDLQRVEDGIAAVVRAELEPKAHAIAKVDIKRQKAAS